jgi:hypothetical protein
MSLGNMRAQGVRSVWAECESCRHEAVNVDRFADAVYVPDLALDLHCSKCRSKRITTWPNWKGRQARGGSRSRAACSRRRSIQ